MAFVCGYCRQCFACVSRRSTRSEAKMSSWKCGRQGGTTDPLLAGDHDGTNDPLQVFPGTTFLPAAHIHARSESDLFGAMRHCWLEEWKAIGDRSLQSDAQKQTNYELCYENRMQQNEIGNLQQNPGRWAGSAPACLPSFSGCLYFFDRQSGR